MNAAGPISQPLQLLATLPRDRPVFMLHSGRFHERWARWSILARPAAILRHDGERTRWALFDPDPGFEPPPLTHDPLVDLDAFLLASGAWASSPCEETALNNDGVRFTRAGSPCSPTDLPFCGGWIGYVSYDLGRRIEPTAVSRGRRPQESGWPLYEWGWCPQAWVFDHATGSRWTIAASGKRERPSIAPGAIESVADASRLQGPARLGPWQAEQSRDEVEAAIERVREHIFAGDIFQANVAQRLLSRLDGEARTIFIETMRLIGAWYAAYLELEGNRRILSLSPELFLDVDPISRRVLTRPLKGTARADASAAALESSEKDRAELNMIVDLMRNDLGRVCEYGSIRVSQPRTVETHPTVHHGVATIEGTLRPKVGFVDLLRATFPGGSITGAPKIRAMQIIDELEPVRRGPYCGSIGYLSHCGRIGLNIAIRTLLLDGDRATYSAGAGIVADSITALEYEEMLDKTAVVCELACARAETPRSGARRSPRSMNVGFARG